MHILHCISGLGRNRGGPSSAIPALCAAVARLGHRVTILAGAPKGADSTVEVPDCVRLVLQPTSRYLKGHSLAMQSWLATHGGDADVVHVHGLWELPTHYALKAAAQLGKPCVLAPIGMLEPQALQRRWFRKKVCWAFSGRRRASTAACFQATSPFEIRNIRRHFPRTPICYVPNGVELPSAPQRIPGEKYLLFLGRVHPHKNVTLLMEAWKALGAQPGWRLVIAGPLEGAYGQRVRHMAAGEGPPIDVIGPVWGEQKWQLLRGARALVLPSKSENFGMVVAEALACHTPAIATTGSPWSELEQHGCGWWVDPRREALANAMQHAVRLSEQERARMGRRGRQLVEDRYTWDRMGMQMAQVYQWMLGAENPPECVVL